MSEAQPNKEAGPGYRLVVRKGKRTGRSHPMAGTSVRIGSERSCEVQVKGEYIDDVHAEIRKNGELWSLENKSVNGTLVNGSRVDMKILEPGDMIQIGGETLFEFATIEVREKKKRDAKGKTKAKRGGMLGNPLVVGGVVAYMLLLVGGGIFFMLRGGGGEDMGMSAIAVETAVSETMAFLQSDAAVEEGGSSSFGRHLDDFADPAADYYRLLEERRRGAVVDASDPRIERLTQALQAEFAAAWLLERQGRPYEAVERYEKIQAMIPDGRAPSTQAAASRELELRSQFQL